MLQLTHLRPLCCAALTKSSLCLQLAFTGGPGGANTSARLARSTLNGRLRRRLSTSASAWSSSSSSSGSGSREPDDDDGLLSGDFDKIARETGASLRLPTGVEYRGHSMAAAGSQTQGHLRGENFFVIHPRIRWGAHSAPATTSPELQLEEAVALVRTLPGFNVSTSAIVGTDYNTKRKQIWGAGRISALLEHKLKHSATAVFINVDMLTPSQQSTLAKIFGVPVYDRYNIVLLIFKLYAKTKEAHLQIALAEIPYIRHRLKFLDQQHASPDALHVNQAVTTLSHSKADKFEILRLREHALKKKLRAVMESKDDELQYRLSKGVKAARSIVIAVIGYTNAGKTTLVKKLTGAKQLHGEDRLFATLDTTVHGALLPSGCHAVFADTIGFISNLPVQLFASFQATLKHVFGADVLIHIQDLSHPDCVTQRDNVIETLTNLGLESSVVNSMITVGNKIDKLDSGQLEAVDGSLQLISCETGAGIEQLIQKIDEVVIRMSGAKRRRFNLKASSSALGYLYKNNFISSNGQVKELEDGNRLQVEVVMTDDQFAVFQASMTKEGSSKLKKMVQSV